MPVLRNAGRVVGTGVRTARATTRGSLRAGRFVTRQVNAARHRGAAGESGMIRLLDLHAASCAGDTLVAIGLAGTIFFSVPAGEARGRVALYLLVTMLPFALLAPVVGPVLDRFRHGRRYALATTMLGRAFLAYMIGEHIGGLTLYPAAFGILVLSRAYGVARSAAVPRVLPPQLRLSEANARASLFGTLAGAFVAPIGVAVYRIGPAWPLRIAMVVFIIGMIISLRLPPRADSDPPETVPRLFIFGRRGERVLSGRLVLTTLAGTAGLRALYGFLALFLAFAIRSGDLPGTLLFRQLSPAASLGVIAAALGAGSLLATLVGTRLRIHRPAVLLAGWLLVALALAVVTFLRYGLLTTALLCLVTAIGSSLAKLAVDAVIQERIPERVRASAFAHSETLLMLAWVAGGALGLIPVTGEVGLGVVALLLLLGSAWAVRGAFAVRRDRLRGSPQPPPRVELPGPAAGEKRTIIPDRSEAVTVDLPAPPPPPRPGDTEPDNRPTEDLDGDGTPGYHLYRPSGRRATE